MTRLRLWEVNVMQQFQVIINLQVRMGISSLHTLIQHINCCFLVGDFGIGESFGEELQDDIDKRRIEAFNCAQESGSLKPRRNQSYPKLERSILLVGLK
jgi:hypothetical protein